MNDLRQNSDSEALRELLARMPDEQPAAEFLIALRRDFREGTVRPSRAHPFWRRPRFRWIATVAAAAAAPWMVLILKKGPSWQMVRASGAGTLFVQGQPIALADVAQKMTMLRPGTDVRLEGDETAMLDLFYPGLFTMQVTPGASLTLPDAPGRWFARSSSFRVDMGEVRVVTGPRFPGSTLRIDAPGTEVHVLGTTFAVMVSSQSTAVCVLEGEASMMMPESTSMMPVPAMRRRTVFMDSHETMEEPIHPMEEMRLTHLRDSAMPVLDGDR